MDTKAEI